ncbi:MAG TPA: DNA polymerase III subunit [Gemmataceae bacterium]|nr:DNA polymerase III subunit [Gemmataceae bacterium]
MSWEAIRGHDAIVRSFDAAWRKGRLGHAYLFVGPPGVGKHRFARELAKALLCEAPKDRLAACSKCGSCILADAGTHPDLHLAGRPEDKVELPIEIIRELVEHLSLKPARGGRKVAILDNADDLNAESANAFLKVLEEPPPGSVLILIGGPTPDRQLPTVQSRCQGVTFLPLRKNDLIAVVKDHGITDASRLDRLVRVADGSPRQALALDDESLWTFRKALLEALAAERVDCFVLAEAWNHFVEDAGKEAGVKRRRAALVLRLLLGMLQDAQRVANGVRPLVADREEAAMLGKLADRLGPEKLADWVDRAIAADVQIDRKVQIDLIIEAFSDYLGR